MGRVSRWIEKKKLRGELMKCFKSGDIVYEQKFGTRTYEYYPKIHDIFIDDEKEAVRFTFTLHNGIDPKEVVDKAWLFQQYFGSNIEISGDVKKFILWVYTKQMPSKVPYNFNEIELRMYDKVVPLVIGYDRRNELLVLDLKKEHHVLITGNTGSGKSTLFKSMLTSLILHKKPHQIQLVMADFKKAEFGIYRNLPHVKEVYMEEKPFHNELKRIYNEMKRRGDLLDQYDLDHVSELPDSLPIIMIVIDELYELTDNAEIMKLLTKISALGRSSQIHILAAMQSGRAKDLGGQFLNNMNCRISGKQADSTNAKVSGLKSTKDISVAGRMVISINNNEQQVQVPFIDKQKAKGLLQPFKQIIEIKEDVHEEIIIEEELIASDIAKLPNLGGLKK